MLSTCGKGILRTPLLAPIPPHYLINLHVTYSKVGSTSLFFYSDKGWREKEEGWGRGVISSLATGPRGCKGGLHRRPRPVTKATAYWAVPSSAECILQANLGNAGPRRPEPPPHAPGPKLLLPRNPVALEWRGAKTQAPWGAWDQRAGDALEAESATSTDSASSFPPSPAAPGPSDAVPRREGGACPLAEAQRAPSGGSLVTRPGAARAPPPRGAPRPPSEPRPRHTHADTWQHL